MFWKRRVYLDSAAGVAGNSSSPHEEGRCAKKILEDARTTIARLAEVQTDDVVFTSGATEANALAILGYVRGLRALAGNDAPGRNNMHVLYLPSAHASIVENMKLLESEGVAVEPLPIKEHRVDTEALAKMIRKETVLVSMEAVCGETGVVWNTRDVAEVLKKQSRSPVLHVDASQAPWTEKVTRDHFGADMVVFDSSKVSMVGACGVLIAHRTIHLAPLYSGGKQERGLRSGTLSPLIAQDFATAFSRVVQNREIFKARVKSEREDLIKKIKVATRDVLFIQSKNQAGNILNMSFIGIDTDYLVALLDQAGFAVSTKSACETDSQEGSRAVLALTGDVDRARSTLRVSWSKSFPECVRKRFVKELARSVGFIRKSQIKDK